jgi:hypothetical protein
MAHLKLNNPTTCGIGTLSTHAPNLQDCAEATLLCVADVDASGMKTAAGQAELLCVASLTGRASGVIRFAAAKLIGTSLISIGRTSITKIIRGGGTIPANACIKSGQSMPKAGGIVKVPKINQSMNVPKASGTGNIPNINQNVSIPKVVGAKTKVLKINNGRNC